MSVLVWDKSEDRRYESGVSKGVLFPKKLMAPMHMKTVSHGAV